MAGLVACDSIIQTIIEKLGDATEAEKQELCAALGCGPTIEEIISSLNDCQGAPLVPGTGIATCADLLGLNVTVVSEDAGNIITEGSDGGAFLGLSDKDDNTLVVDPDDGGLYVPPGQGEQGPKGDKGDKGDPGEQGPKGDKGDPGDGAATFVNCAGTTHASGASIPSCDELDAAIDNLAENITSHIRNCAGEFHVPNTTMPSCVEMDAAIAAAINNSGGGPDDSWKFRLIATRTANANTIPTVIVGPPGTEIRLIGETRDANGSRGGFYFPGQTSWQAIPASGRIDPGPSLPLSDLGGNVEITMKVLYKRDPSNPDLGVPVWSDIGRSNRAL